MKIVVLLFATFFGFGLACQDLSYTHKATRATIVYEEAPEEPVATFALDTIEVVYKAPVPLAAN